MIQNKWSDKVLKFCGKKKLPIIDWYKISEYASWYQGKVDSFHNYMIYNGERQLMFEKKSMQMPKMVCETWANILFSDQFRIVLENTKDNELFQELYKSLDFKNKLSNAVEKSFALSFGVLVASVDDLLIGENSGHVKASKDTKLKLRFYDATSVVPIKIIDDELIECAFVTSDEEQTAIAIYRLNEKKEYTILNLLFDNEKSDNPIEIYEFNTGYKEKPFALIKPNLNNNTFGISMLGMSIYGNSIDSFKAIDDTYDGFCNEITLSRKRLFLTTKAFDMIPRQNDDGTFSMQRVFDVNSSLFYKLTNEEENPKDTIQAEASQIRDGSYGAALKYFLNVLGKQVGFGNNFFKFENEKVYQSTTTVATANQELMKNFKKHSSYLETEITNLVLYIKHLNNNFTLNDKLSDFKRTDVIVDFDDSVIESTEEKKTKDLLEIEKNIMSISEYREKWYGEDKEKAKETYQTEFRYDLIKKYASAVQDGLMTPEDFVKIVYGENADNKIVEYVETHAVINSIDKEENNYDDEENIEELDNSDDEEE